MTSKKPRITLATVTARQCRWPIGDPQERGFHLCGEPKPLAFDMPYCDEHARIAYTVHVMGRRPRSATTTTGSE